MPPNPLPQAWLRLLGNSIVSEFRRTGWRTHKTSRAWNPTGNPRSSYGSAAPVVRSKLLTNTETFETVKYVQGTVEPVSIVGVPPLAWLLTAQVVGECLPAEFVEPLNSVMNRNRGDAPFLVRRNGRGEVSVGSSRASFEERTAVTLVAALAEVRVLDEVDYWGAVGEGFDAEFTIQVLEGQL